MVNPDRNKMSFSLYIVDPSVMSIVYLVTENCECLLTTFKIFTRNFRFSSSLEFRLLWKCGLCLTIFMHVSFAYNIR